jgi:Ca-activated chloride channel family protein
MKPHRFLVAAFLLAAVPHSCLSADAQQKAQEQAPTIRVAVDRVNIGVIVTDRDGNFVDSLHREDFQVCDNGVEQPITDFLSVAEPAQVLLLIESGPAVVFLGKEHFHAADTLLNNLEIDDRVAIASYSKDPELLLDFTANKAAARFALENLNFMLGFSDLNLSSGLASAIDWLGTVRGKKTIVVLSTGVDTSPEGKWQAAEQKLETSDVRVLAVSLSGDFRKPIKQKVLTREEKKDQAFLKEGFAAADQSLRELSRITGGRVYFPKNQKEFNRAYAEIAQLIRHEYSLAFAPPAHDGQMHSITVKVQGFERGVNHRQAYLAPAAVPAVSPK